MNPHRVVVSGSLSVLLVAMAALGPVACGDEETPKATPFRIEVTESAPHRFRYSAPASVAAGLVEIELENRGKEEHKAQLWRILDRHSVKQALAARRPLPDWLRSEGGVGETAPGRSASVVQRLAPGRYYIADSGGDKGRVASFAVRGDESADELPSTKGKVVMKDYSFITTGVKPGTSSVELVNEGFEPHHLVVAPVKRGGSSVGQLRRFLKGTGPIPVGEVVDLERAQETAVIEQGQRQVATLRLKRGTYGLLCFVPDRKGGPAHVVKGMVDKLTVR